MVNTVITIPITANLIVFIAGLILSSFHHDNINNKPHRKIKTIDSIPEAKTKSEIASNIKSQNSIAGQKTLVCSHQNAFTTSITIIHYL